ncbi:N-alpha-acetyltransferase, 35 NatC auxiliary subunit [Trametes pubescens]|uniref:N-alpha-acetyltransferase, 35 NatC auxiliary subunit n=1 Tax=Trametes pubescens TaxID=154538 RepID=A0A1M2V344_TRAPU|nr:N-alpha-acetyltransferase, 35 NatC auxiliary subunit [Trametes pubescens]
MVGYSGFDDDNDDFEMPGGDDFMDVTELFVAGGRDMEPEEVVLMDNFTLMDAMSAFEIGEPRLDSGMILEEQRRPPFDPLTPLLPEEVCWILDRSFACEMEWHAGKTLSQSVFTVLFVHHLPDINPEYLPPDEREIKDPARPRWLITVVVRAAMLGLLKCCDFAWRELSKNKVHDVEDWQGEKCDVSLLEGVNAEVVSRILDSACEWLRQSDLTESQVAALCDRLLLRKAILELYRSNPLKDSNEVLYGVAAGVGLVHRIRGSSRDLAPDSPARLAMDPYIARRLPNFMPIRVTELPSYDESWDALSSFLEEWQETQNLVASPSLVKWEAAGSLRFALGKSVAPPFHRSLIQTLFFDKNIVLGEFSPTWLVERFFEETIGYPYTFVRRALEHNAPHIQPASTHETIERRIMKLMTPHVRSSWYNPPRRRRHLMKEVLQWHMLHEVLLDEVEQRQPHDTATARILSAIPLAAQLGRLSACREVIISGFQQELYAPEEKPIAYWYLSRVLDAHMNCIENLLPSVPQDSTAYRELTFQAVHLSALQMISTTLVVLTAGYITSPWRRITLNFLKRYKWIFNPDFDDLVPAEPIPDLLSFPNSLKEFLLDEHYSPSSTFQLAEDICTRLGESSYDWLGYWASDRIEYLRNLASACDRLKHVAPTDMRQLPGFNLIDLKWMPAVHPWLPTVA